MTMRKKELMIVATVAFVFGVAGSMVGIMIFDPRPAIAQEGNTILAEQFLVVDKAGQLRAMLAQEDAGGAGLYFYDEEGNVRTLVSYTPSTGPIVVISHSMSVPGAIIAPDAIQLLDTSQEVKWEAP